MLHKGPYTKILLSLFVLGLSSITRASNDSAVTVEWFEPKVRLTSRVDVFHVIVEGKTLPDTNVELDPHNITIIQRADSSSNFIPRVGAKNLVSDAKGSFHLDLYMPLGLSQATIGFKSSIGTTFNKLLVMRVDAENVSLNVKVTRPTKIVKVMVEPKRRYFLSVGLAPEIFQEKLAIDSQNGLSLQSTALTSLQFEASSLSGKWWWLSGFRYSSFTDFSTQAIMLGSRYKLNRGKSQFWAGIEVSGESFPLAAASSLNQSSLFKTSLYSVGGGFTFRRESESSIKIASLNYRAPFSLRIESGQLAHESQYDLVLRTNYDYKFSNWFAGAGLEAFLLSFKYQYANSPSSISNSGSGTLSNFVILLRAGRIFGSSSSEKPNP